MVHEFAPAKEPLGHRHMDNLEASLKRYLTPDDQRFEFCIVSRFKNAGEWLPEWVEYHRLMGVEHFIIGDDCSTDGRSHAVLDAYRTNTDYVTYFKGAEVPYGGQANPHRCADVAAGRAKRQDLELLDFLTHHAKSMGCNWVGLIDIDEFISFTEGGAVRFGGDVRKFLAQFKLWNLWIRLAWWEIQHEGQETRPAGLVIENYSLGEVVENAKSIIRVQATKHWAHPHFPRAWKDSVADVLGYGQRYRPNYHMVSTEEMTRTELVTNSTGQQEVRLVPAADLFLKHYKFKSYAEYMRSRGSRKTSSTRDGSIWAEAPRQSWEAHRRTPDPKYLFHEGFTRSMVPLVKARLAEIDSWLPDYIPAPGEGPAPGGG